MEEMSREPICTCLERVFALLNRLVVVWGEGVPCPVVWVIGGKKKGRAPPDSGGRLRPRLTRRAKIKVPANSVSGEGPLPGS